MIYVQYGDLSVFEKRTLARLCQVNDVERQRGGTDQMVFNIPTLLAYISAVFTLQPGDLVLTGTPAGVGQVLLNIIYIYIYFLVMELNIFYSMSFKSQNKNSLILILPS